MPAARFKDMTCQENYNQTSQPTYQDMPANHMPREDLPTATKIWRFANYNQTTKPANYGGKI